MIQLVEIKKPTTPSESPPEVLAETPGPKGDAPKSDKPNDRPKDKPRFRIPDWGNDTKPRRQSLSKVVGQYLPSADNPREGSLVLSHGIYPAVMAPKVNMEKLGEEQRLFRAWLKQEDRRFRFEIISYGDIPEGHQDHAIIAGLFWKSYPKGFQMLVKPIECRGVEPFKISIAGKCLRGKAKGGDIVRVGCLLSDRGLYAIVSEDLRNPVPAKEKKTENHSKNEKAREDIKLTTAKMDVTLKINEIPAGVETLEKGLRRFDLDCDGCVVRVTIKPKMWKKMEEAQKNYPFWVASISGKMGEATEKGFILDQPNIQVFERKPKPPKEGE